MSYLVLDNFAAGLETRKSPLTAPPGSLLRLRNAVITPGGEIAKRRAFVKVADLRGTFGLVSTARKLVVFSRNVDVPAPAFPVPGVSLVVQKLAVNSATAQQADYDIFNGKVYVVLNDPAGGTDAARNPHFYDGVETQGSGKGFYVRTFQSKVYTVRDQYLHFSAVNDPTKWDTSATGAGFVNLALQDADAEFLTGLEIYYDKLAVMSSESTQIWAVDPDPAQNNLNQVLRGTGTSAPRSIQQYGSGDILFLASSGVRSLKARDSSNSAAVTDIGSPIDQLIADIRKARGGDYLKKAIALLEPVVGRFWMVLPNEILVLSYFPGPKITAWSTFSVPFTIDYAAACGDKIYLRAGDDLYAFGGADGETYDNCGVEVRLPYLDAKKPGHFKMFEAFDATVFGTWRVAVSYTPEAPDAEETIGTITKPTWNLGRQEMQGHAPHFSLRLYNEDTAPATIANLAAHFQMAADED